MAVKRSAKKVAKKTIKRAAKRVAKKTVKRARRVVVWGPSGAFTPPPPPTKAKIAKAYGPPLPSGYGIDPMTGLITPKASQVPIKPSRLKKGLEDARRVIDSSIAEIMAPSDDYDIKAIELSLTFGLKGEFLGFGGSGGTTVKVTIGPPSKGQVG